MKELKVNVKKNKDVIKIRITGGLGGLGKLPKLSDAARKTIEIDLAGLEYINSFGASEWIKWVHSLNKSKLILFNCNPVIIDYANLVEGFIPNNASIKSFNVPYFCSSCQNTDLKTFETDTLKKSKNDVEKDLPCPNCKSKMEIDVIPSQFFKFLRN